MAYLAPPVFVVKVFNRIALATGMSGSVALTVRGRRSGQEQTIPVIPVSVGGADYLVSTRGESQWVKNVRAAGEVTVTSRKQSRTRPVTEVSVTDRAPVIAAYREKAGRTVETYWKQLPDDADHPVFRLA